MSERSAAETIYPNQGGAAQPEAAPPAEAPAPDTAAPAAEAPASETPTLLTEGTTQEAAPETPAEPPPPPFEADKITFPEGVQADPAIFGKFGEIASKSGMSQETAQSLMNLYHEVAGVQATKNLEAWKTTREGWVAEVRADREIGGNNLDGVKRTVSRILDDASLTDPKFREALEVTGIGDNTAAIRTLYRWAKALTEGSHVGGDAPSQRAPRSLAEVMYPHLSQTEPR
jgi:hypothetical protein